MNLTLVIGINFFIAFLIPIILYLFVLKPGISPISEFVLFPLVLFGVTFFLAFMTSVIASKEKCDSFNWLTSITNGMKTPFAVCITYVMIFLIPELTFPFMRITGPLANEPVVAYIAQAILIAFATLPATVSIWLSSQKYGCVLSPEQLAEMNRKNAEELNKSPPDPNSKPETVTI